LEKREAKLLRKRSDQVGKTHVVWKRERRKTELPINFREVLVWKEMECPKKTPGRVKSSHKFYGNFARETRLERDGMTQKDTRGVKSSHKIYGDFQVRKTHFVGSSEKDSLERKRSDQVRKTHFVWKRERRKTELPINFMGSFREVLVWKEMECPKKTPGIGQKIP